MVHTCDPRGLLRRLRQEEKPDLSRLHSKFRDLFGQLGETLAQK